MMPAYAADIVQITQAAGATKVIFSNAPSGAYRPAFGPGFNQVQIFGLDRDAIPPCEAALMMLGFTCEVRASRQSGASIMARAKASQHLAVLPAPSGAPSQEIKAIDKAV